MGNNAAVMAKGRPAPVVPPRPYQPTPDGPIRPLEPYHPTTPQPPIVPPRPYTPPDTRRADEDEHGDDSDQSQHEQ